MAMPCKQPPPLAHGAPPRLAVVILAGGRSSRMGRDKAGLSLGGRSLLSWIRATARQASPRVQVLRRDLLPGCGPLGGIQTALQKPPAPRVLFLSCDMPSVSPEWLRQVAAALRGRNAVFTELDGLAGFPFALDAHCLATVEQQLRLGQRSLQALATALQARRLRVPARRALEFGNINTPADLRAARERHRQNQTRLVRPTRRPAPPKRSR